MIIIVTIIIKTTTIIIIIGPPNGPVLFCSLASVVCRRLLSFVIVVCNATGGRSGLPPGTWAVDRRQAGRMGGRAADTARRASTVTSR